MSVLYVLVLTNPIHHLIFTVDMTNGYQRGSWIFVLYIISFCYMLVGVGVLFYARKSIGRDKWFALLVNYLFSFAAILAQFYLHDLMVELFSTALAFLLITLVVLRPEETTEPLTGLPSYTSFTLELKKALITKERAQFLFIRVKNRSQIKAFVSEEGLNKVYQHFYSTILSLARKSGIHCEVFFYQPNLFAIIIDDINYDVEKMMDALSKDSFELPDQHKEMYQVRFNFVSTSITLPNPDFTYDSIITLSKQFDIYTEKGKNYVPSSKIITSVPYVVSVNLSSIIKRGLANHGFEMYYQPIYDFETKSFRSAEALLRLKDEQYGMISPGILIPTAEQKQLMSPISDFVLEETYRFIGSKEFRASGVDYIEINLSMQKCTDPKLPSQVQALAGKYHVNPKNINFEITESVFSQDNNILKKNLKELLEQGYSFSMDDYGTGYSNVRRLLSIPFEIVKVDKSLVDAAATQEGLAVLENSVNMIKNIHKVPLAEGVEEKEQLDLLQKLGVKYIQGYVFSKAIPEKEYLEFVRLNNRR